jgi:asparagine synthase (glutamine-hydrolysing)
MDVCHPLVRDYIGCSGHIDLQADESQPIQCWCVSFNDRRISQPQACYALQWLHPDISPEGVSPLWASDQEYILLSGLPAQPLSQELVQQIHTNCTRGDYTGLTQIAGEFVGCVVTRKKLFLFRSVTSNETIFYRKDGTEVRWSTDPSELLLDGYQEFDQDALWRCCRGDMVFVYRNLKLIRPGYVVVIDAHSNTAIQYDRLMPLDLPSRTTLQAYAKHAYDLLLQATRPYAASGRVGILLSGGIDSTLVLMALVDQGADVIAYHMDTDAPLAREFAFAREVCDQLSVPLVSIRSNADDDYFSEMWEFPHPYNHVWYQRMKQVAARVRQDGITLLCNGCDGDILFGPLRYGLYDILLGDVSWREKWAMIQGVLCSRWEWSRVVSSIVPSFSLMNEARADARINVDFLTPPSAGISALPDEHPDLEFLPQEQTADLGIWRPQGIFLCSPIGDKALQRLALRLPHAYRLIPIWGHLIDKPVLRLILSQRFPAHLWQRQRCPWLISPDQHYCLSHPEVFATLLGCEEAYLVRLNIVNPEQLTQVLANPVLLRRHAETLICSAMTELFLRSLAKRGVIPIRGGTSDAPTPII